MFLLSAREYSIEGPGRKGRCSGVGARDCLDRRACVGSLRMQADPMSVSGLAQAYEAGRGEPSEGSAARLHPQQLLATPDNPRRKRAWHRGLTPRVMCAATAEATKAVAQAV